MKGLILSGGKGTRLRPLTLTSAKQLLPVANKPILFYAIEALVEAGIREIGIIVGDTAKEIEAAVGNGKRWGAKITYLPQDAPRGLAHAVLVAEKFIGREPFVVYLGDNVIKDGVTTFVEHFERTGPDAMILLAHVPDARQYGVAQVRGDRVVKLVEKPKRPPSDLALVGVYLFNARIFAECRRLRPSRRGEYEITDAISGLIRRGRAVEHRVIRGWWKDTGRAEDLLDANRLLLDLIRTRIDGRVDKKSRLDGPVQIERGARVIASRIHGPVAIGAGAVVDHAEIGPFTSVAAGAVVRRARVSGSIVMEGSRVEGVHAPLNGCLIGRNVTVSGRGAGRGPGRVVVGDNSVVVV